MKGGNMRVVLMVTLALFILMLSTIGKSIPQTQEWPKSMTILDGRSATSVYALATGIADLFFKNIGIKTVPEAGTMGRNAIFVHKKEAEFALVNNERAYFAARGLEEYKSYGKMNIRLLFSSSVSAPMFFVTRRDAAIISVPDLKGKKVMCLYPGNPAFTKGADFHFEAVGMNRADVQAISFSGHEEGDMALKERRISAYIHPMTVTSLIPFVQQLNLEMPIRLVGAPLDKLDATLPKYPYFRKDVIPAKVYGDITDNKDLVGIGPAEIFISQGGLSEDLIYRVMKAIFEHLPELYQYTPIARVWTSDPLASAVLPYHLGAIKYYKEKKLWTEDLEKKQKQLLAEVGVSK